jgi:hypothetical protein
MILAPFIVRRCPACGGAVGVNLPESITECRCPPMVSNDISAAFTPNQSDAAIMGHLLQFEGTERAVVEFTHACGFLSDLAYWYTLGTLWVSYTGWSEIAMWRRLLSADRSDRTRALLRPSEYEALKRLPQRFSAFRAHRLGETDWLSYTLNPVTAALFTRRRGVERFTEYSVPRKDVTALFLRRGEDEILVLDRRHVRRIQEWQVKKAEAA